MYAQVVVLTYQPPDVDSYTYEIPKDLNIKIGQLVEVPFGKRNPQGIVTKVHNKKPQVATKPITKIVLQNTVLLPYQIELLEWMSNYYIAPTVNCLEAMLPDIPKKLEDLNQKTTKISTQTLILVPAINRIPETLAKFPKAKNYIVFHNELKVSEKFTSWQKILDGNADCVFGSRSAIFLPFPNLSEIIIYDEHDGAYKDDRSPYFDTLTIAQKISSLTKAQVKIVDPAPKITTYHELSSYIKIQKFNTSVQTINMQNEKLSGRRSPISFDLEEEIKVTRGNILLFLNRRKESGHLFCKSCKTSQNLEKQPSACPNCKSPDIFWNVLNIDSLKTEVKKLFPKSQIDINTALALYAPLAKKYDLIGHIQADSLLSLADYTGAEKLFAQVVQLKKLLSPGGKLMLQTYNQDHPTINAIAIGDFQTFYKTEIKQRKLLSYPPYSLLAKATFRGKSQEKVKAEAENLINRLKQTENLNFQILGPYKSIFWKKEPIYHIIFKHKVTRYSLTEKEKAINMLAKYLKPGNKNYTIEIEPEGIQS